MTTSEPHPLPLDADGLLPPGAASFPARAAAYTVFAQQADAHVDAATWQRHAKQFFDADVVLTRPKRYGAVLPDTDGMHVVVSRHAKASDIRSVFLRPRTPVDLESAEDAERAAGGGGLSLLAKRCQTVVLVATEREVDETALFLSAVIASVVLGPILSPDKPEIFGVRTARLKLDKLGA